MDNTKPETQHQQPSDTEMTSDFTSPPQQDSDISPGAYPAPLQPSGSLETRSRSRAGSSSPPPPRNPEEVEPSAVSSSGHERMPSVNSLPPREGQFGLVSSSGQLVCEFRAAPAGEAPDRPPKVPEGNYYITSASFATTSQSNPRVQSVSPPPHPATPPLSSPSGGGGGLTASTLELVIDHNSYPEAVDRNSYPEVYIPGDQQLGPQAEQPGPELPPRRSSPSIIPRKSLPMDNHSTGSSEFFHHPSSPPLVSSPPAPAYSTPADYQRIGYAGTLDMSTAVATVTPLHMLGDQPDTVDCPFCMRRVETRVKKRASRMTHTLGAILLFSTLFGVVAPYCCNWYVNVEHYCKNCSRKVAHKKFDSDETEALGTRPEHRQVSCYEPAEKPDKKKKRRSRF